MVFSLRFFRLNFLRVFLILTNVCAAHWAHAENSPSTEWKTWTLPHFELVYDAKHQKLAEAYASYLEEAVKLLSPMFPEIPDNTTVVLNDRTDLTNGFATPIPYPMVMVYPVLPGPAETISEYGNWERELILHEYSHVLALTSRRDVVKGLRYVFGTIIAPNLLLPRWWHEGLAVEMETRLSSHGRLRSIYQDASMRNYWVNNLWDSIVFPDINEVTIPTWPYGGRPYLHGSYLWSYLIKKKNPSVVKDLTYEYGGRFPYFINWTAEDMLGKTYQDYFAEMKAELARKVSNQTETLKKVPLPATQDLNFTFVETQAPSISPDGLKMAFVAKDETTRRSVQILIRDRQQEPFSAAHLRKADASKEGEGAGAEGVNLPRPRGNFEQDGPPVGTIQRLSWFPDSNRFVYDKHADINRFQDASDLWVYDLNSKKSTQLTEGLRAREPAVAPSGKVIAYVQLDAGQTSLAEYDVTANTRRILFIGEIGDRVSNPVYQNENQILFALRHGGQDRLQLFDRSSLKITSLPSEADTLFPTLRGRSTYVANSLNGTFNVYSVGFQAKDSGIHLLQPLTHTLTTVSAFDVDQNGDIYFSELASGGWKIRRLPAAEIKKLPNRLPKIQGLMSDVYPPAKAGDTKVSSTPLKAQDVDDYSPWSYLIPRYWFPSLFVDSTGTSGSLSTAASDPLGKHAYSLFAAYDSETKRGSYSLIYMNNSFWPQLAVSSGVFNQYLLTESTISRTQLNRAQAMWELLFWTPDAQAGFGWTWLGHELSTQKTYQLGPSLLFNYVDFAMAGAQISPESGQGAQVVYTNFLKSEDRVYYNDFEFSLLKYSNWLLPKRHAMMFKLQGHYVDRDIPVANYAITTAFPVFANTNLPQYIIRGYPSSQFLAKNIASFTTEYRFPIQNVYKGWGTNPFYIKRLHAAVVADGIMVDGYGFNFDSKLYSRTNPWKSIWGAGAEIKADMTLGYHFPLTFYFGIYAPLDKDWKSEDSRTGFGLLF